MAKSDAILKNGTMTGVVSNVPSAYANDIQVEDNGVTFVIPNAETKISDAGIGIAIEKLGAAYLPTGFVYVEGTLEEGIVIKNSTDDNEFVWVPVLKESEFIRENFLAQSDWANYKEYDEITPEASQPAEYKAMRESVAKYKGFYIARYEAGIATNMPQSAPTSDTTATYGTEAYKPVSKPNTFVWNYISWSSSNTTGGGEPTGYAGDPTLNGAVKVARAMYPEASATTVGSPVSTLIYGEQWDATMRYMKDIPNPNVQGAKYITNSTDMGHYKSYSTRSFKWWDRF